MAGLINLSSVWFHCKRQWSDRHLSGALTIKLSHLARQYNRSASAGGVEPRDQERYPSTLLGPEGSVAKATLFRGPVAPT